MILQSDDIQAYLPSIAVNVRRFPAFAMAARVKGDDSIIPDEIRQNARRNPGVEGVPEAVNQDDCISIPLFYISNAHPIGIEEFVLCDSRHRYQQKT